MNRFMQVINTLALNSLKISELEKCFSRKNYDITNKLQECETNIAVNVRGVF